MASTEIVQLRASGEVILERKPASVPMRDKNAQESDNGTSPASDDDSEAIQTSDEGPGMGCSALFHRAENAGAKK